MGSQVPPKKNTAFEFYVCLPSQSDVSIFQASPTLAAGDVKVAVDDAAPANITTLPVVDADFVKRVKVSLTAAEMNGDKITVLFSDASGAEWADLVANIHTAAQTDDETKTALDAKPTAAQNATAWGARVIGNARTADMYLQGLVNRIEFAADGLTFTIYEADDTTPLYQGTSVRFGDSINGLRSVNPI